MVLKDFRKRLSVLKNRIWPDWSDEEYVHQRFHICNQGSASPLILYAGLGSDYGRPGRWRRWARHWTTPWVCRGHRTNPTHQPLLKPTPCCYCRPQPRRATHRP